MKKELWLRLRGYRFDALVPPHLTDRVAAAFGGADASTHAFAAKVARKQRWTTPFALHAVTEYKKFVYLGMVADFGVTPPTVIDAVWHEHLLFSRAYRDFCDNVLGRHFDHHPELMPSREQTDVFQAQYAATLACYRTEFNAAPPADVWGTPKFRPLEDAGSGELRLLQRESTVEAGYYDDTPLYMYFESSGSGDGHSSGDSGFGGGGGFSGGGGGSDWGGHSSSDSSPGDTGSSGDGGGSGCSSSCGSGCGGGD